MTVRAENLSFTYGSRKVLHSVNLSMESSKILGIIGPNGSGKSTLLKCLNRILEPEEGRVFIDGQDISSMSRLSIARLVSYVPQSSPAKDSITTVFEITAMGRRPHIRWKIGKNDERIVWEVLESMGIAEFAPRQFNSLSGGEKQKVLIARALAQQTGILLMDEPTSNLDIHHQIEVMEFVTNMAGEKNISVCTIIHDLELALKYCSKIIMLKEGRVFASGGTLDVITAENILNVYNVRAVIDEIRGRPHVVLL